MSYLSEFHGVQYRSRVMISTGIFFSLAAIIMPGMAWIIIPQSWDLTIVEGWLELHTWQLFLAVSAAPSLISGLSLLVLPESPKFLMSRGKNDEALQVFQFIHKMNNGSLTDYPVSHQCTMDHCSESTVCALSSNPNYLINFPDKKSNQRTTEL